MILPVPLGENPVIVPLVLTPVHEKVVPATLAVSTILVDWPLQMVSVSGLLVTVGAGFTVTV